VKLRTRFDLNWILVLLLTVFALAPLTYPGFFEASSGYLPAYNAANPSDAPNWQGMSGPVRGEGRLPYLLAWPFYALSGSGITAVKWGYGLAFLLGALGIYAWTRRRLGTKGGVLSAAVYTYLPWHLSTVYTRGAYAEAWLWAFWPWILWAIERLAERRARRTLVGIVAGLALAAATLWTQPGLAALAVPLFVAYGVIATARQPWHWLHLIEALGLSFLFLWLAARRAAQTQIPFADHFLHPFQLFSAAWGSELTFQLGLAAVGLSIVAVALQAGRRETTPKTEAEMEGGEGGQSAPETTSVLSTPLNRVFWFWGSVLLAIMLLCLPVSAWLWEVSSLANLLTYPWQILALSGVPLAFLAGSVIRLDRRFAALPTRWAGVPAWAGLVALVVLASYPYLAPRYTQVDAGSEPVALLQPVEAEAPQIMLLDYEVGQPAQIDATQALTLTLAWQVVEPVAGDYTVFVHVLSPDGTKVAQRDTRPCDGECPTNTWQPGDVIIDRYQLDWTQDTGAAAPGPLPRPTQLAVGLYLVESGDRALVVGREDRTVFLDVP
jgi:hypothetical protein